MHLIAYLNMALATLGIIFSLCAADAVPPNDAQSAMNLINYERQLNGLAPLSWDATLANHALAWASSMAQFGFGHSSPQMRIGEGEVLYWFWDVQRTNEFDTPMTTATNVWLAERKYYRGQPFGTPGSDLWDHYSESRSVCQHGVMLIIVRPGQLMWRTSNRIGLGVYWDITKPYTFYVVGRVSPEGNV
jgi:hypothetical protein